MRTHDLLFDSYAELMTDYLHQQGGGDRDKVLKFVEKITRERYKPFDAAILENTSPGNVKLSKLDFLTFINSIKGKIITPSGSCYMSPEEKVSVISQMLDEKLIERKAIKKEQFAAAAVNNKSEFNRLHYQQATIKINANSMPGGFGSAYNIFYDKGGYNSITSTARCMIGRAYTVAEQLLGGNFAWFSEEELLNHILLLNGACPSEEKINTCIKKYKLRIPTVLELKVFYKETLTQYVPKCDMSHVNNLLDTLSQNTITYLYYYCNLKHIMWGNDKVFRGYFHHVMDISNVKKNPNVVPSDLWKMDDTVLAVATVSHAPTFENRSMKVLIEEYPEDAKYLHAIVLDCEKKLHTLDELFDTFVNTNVDIQEIQTRPNMLRNTVPFSDTDSLATTAKAWDQWLRGNDKMDLEQSSYQISTLTTYWLTHTVKYALKRFSVKHGVTGDLVHTLAMKNEFLYSAMLLYDTKKTYAGIQIVQEGVILPVPEKDIKGQKLRGSVLCKESLDFAEDLIVNEILTPAMQGKVSANDLIAITVNYENKIRKSITAGETDFMKITSLKNEKDYKNPMQTSVYYAYMFWETVFAEKYGSIQPPLKTTFFKTITPGSKYYKALAKKEPLMEERMRNFVDTNGKFPGTIIINPLLEAIPEELVPIIDVRAIITHNIKPAYYTLDRLGISCGFEKQELLLSDIYKVVDNAVVS